MNTGTSCKPRTLPSCHHAHNLEITDEFNASISKEAQEKLQDLCVRLRDPHILSSLLEKSLGYLFGSDHRRSYHIQHVPSRILLPKQQTGSIYTPEATMEPHNVPFIQSTAVFKQPSWGFYGGGGGACIGSRRKQDAPAYVPAIQASQNAQKTMGVSQN